MILTYNAAARWRLSTIFAAKYVLSKSEVAAAAFFKKCHKLLWGGYD